MKKILIKVINAVLIALVALLVVFFVMQMVGRVRGEPMFLFGHSLLIVTTNSMEPEIPAKSFILVERADTSAICVGDVITFRSEDPSIKGQLNTHRVNEIDEAGRFVTKGDNNLAKDRYPVEKGDVVAKFVAVVPILSALCNILFTPYKLLIMVAVIALIAVTMHVIAGKRQAGAEQSDAAQ